jgi:hypothetical protein
MNPYTPPRAEIGNHQAYPQPGGGPIPEGVIDLLRQTRPWVQFISVLCFLGSGFMLLASVAMLALSALPKDVSSKEPIPGWLGVVYLPLAAIYVYPGIKLWGYASAISRLIATRSSGDLENALRQQKSFWKFSGISAIALMVLYVLIFVGAIVYGVMQAATKT